MVCVSGVFYLVSVLNETILWLQGCMFPCVAHVAKYLPPMTSVHLTLYILLENPFNLALLYENRRGASMCVCA